MTLLTLEEAAARVGAPRATIEEWVRSGILAVQVRPRSGALSAGDRGAIPMENYVDDEELFEKAESAGWFELGAENWDSAEDT